MPLNHEALADVIVLAMKTALGPLVAELAEVRLELARLDARALVPGPAGERGEAGERGADGLGFEELGVAYDGDRTVTLAFTRGLEQKTFPLVFPFPRYRGEYHPGTVYAVGDVIRHGGSAWHCMAATTAAPAENRDEWALMVRRGRDGKRV